MSASMADIGMYNKDLLSDVKKLKAINITGKDLTKDQLIQAYICQLEAVVELYNLHYHPGNGMKPTEASITAAPSLDLWSTKLNDFTFGEGAITDSSSYTNKLNHSCPLRNPNSLHRM